MRGVRNALTHAKTCITVEHATTRHAAPLVTTPGKREAPPREDHAFKRLRHAREASPRGDGGAAEEAPQPKTEQGDAAARAASPTPAPSPARELTHMPPPPRVECVLLYVHGGASVANCDENSRIAGELSRLGFVFAHEPTPHWTLPRAMDADVRAALEVAAASRGCELHVKRHAPPRPVARPTCPIHHKPCVLRTAGSGLASTAKPYNLGRRFWRCPIGDHSDCTFLWEEGTGPMDDPKALRRYRKFARHGAVDSDDDDDDDDADDEEEYMDEEKEKRRAATTAATGD